MAESISVVIPVYKAENSLRELYNRLKEHLEKISKDFEIIMVEDCGGDKSWDIIKELSSADSQVRGIQLSRNFGQHNALLCGIRNASKDIIVTLDDDLQHPVEEIGTLLKELSLGYDVVYGTPEKEQHGFLRDISSMITKIVLSNVMGAENARHVSAFRVFHAQLREAFADYHGSFVSIDVLLTWGTTRFSAISVYHDLRRSGQSNYTFRKLVTHALNMVTGFSTVPLRLASLIGFVFTFFGIITLFYVIGRYFVYGRVVPGFPFLASIISIFSGAQLFALGVIGEYLVRMHFRIMDKPPYV
ncbi:MAG: glycosyltransferase family 2 protein, partial [Candidatus Omnitrophota bacterium]